MTNLRFHFQRLPDDLYSKVLKTMEHPEIIAYSFTSKKSFSFIQTLGLSLEDVHIKMEKLSAVYLNFGCYTVEINMRMGENGREKTSLDDIPVSVDVSTEKIDWSLNRETMEWRIISESTVSTWSNQEKSIGEWIQHLCSIFRCEDYESEFQIKEIRVDIQSLRNIFPKLRRVYINGFTDDPSEHDIQSYQIILRAFLPDVQNLRLYGVPLQENLSLEHIGMANLKELELYSPRNPKLENLQTLNVERCSFYTDQFSLRDLNRFFKLWMKGSNPKLKYLEVDGETIADWNDLMKGLKAEETRRLQEEGEADQKEYIIQNCYGSSARIMLFKTRFVARVQFTVLN
ncbi:hypothetical protein B9Z55_011134 [Caenorhabditis nigoni]|uniref:F-box domain-containing protein n=1 Tax=Caenorhabditis nigoni TaxID=1611254 RepID=A0A2G5UIS1_9PELO|nr:hypothetical protein B9Z55_011134 [Caenorhabditis nigoni]